VQQMSVSDYDFRMMMRIVDGSADRSDPYAPMAPEVLSGLTELIPCDDIVFSMFDAETREYFVDQDLCGFYPPEVRDSDEWDRVFWEHYWDSLACSYPDTSKDLSTITTMSDFYSDSELRAQGMYREYFRPLGVQREMMMCLPSRPGRALRLLFLRGPGRDFSPRDRDLLKLLRPHLNQIYRQRQATSSPLTPRQRQLLDLVTAGLTNRQIARRLSISEATVRKHLQHVFERLQVTNRTAAALHGADESARSF
jgi:DNA-binding CsgD family transcriptional regulator